MVVRPGRSGRSRGALRASGAAAPARAASLSSSLLLLRLSPCPLPVPLPSSYPPASGGAAGWSGFAVRRSAVAVRPSPGGVERRRKGAGEGVRARRWGFQTCGGRPALFDSGGGHGLSPQIGGKSSVHTLGTGKLSLCCPQAGLLTDHRARSGGCGFVANRNPQAVDRASVHRGPFGLSTGCPQAGGGCPQLLHTPVHCSATRHRLSPSRVKAVTSTPGVGLWGTWVKLGTALGRSRLPLCMGCAELSAVHRSARLSTTATHRPGG